MRTNWVMTLAAFAVACLLLAIAPRPSVAVVIRETLRSGRGPWARGGGGDGDRHPRLVCGRRALPLLPSMLELGVVWAVIDGSWCVFVAWGVSHARQVLARPRVRQRLEQLTGFVLIALGVRLATDGR
jgi:threonine/homoserine/homoserine lactone efflux protein